jgi:hypothetical protein
MNMSIYFGGNRSRGEGDKSTEASKVSPRFAALLVTADTSVDVTGGSNSMTETSLGVVDTDARWPLPGSLNIAAFSTPEFGQEAG